MRSSTVLSACYVNGLPHTVEVTATIRPGLPNFSIIGLADRLIRESTERVKSAILASNFAFPRGKVVVSLTPAALPKAGTQLDLAIAVSILSAAGIIIRGRRFIGELLTNGLCVLHLHQARLIEKDDIVGVCQHIFENNSVQVVASLQDLVANKYFTPQSLPSPIPQSCYLLDSVQGLSGVIRALSIALCGKHTVLMSGPAGVGKTFLARAFAELLPFHTAESYRQALAWQGSFSQSPQLSRYLLEPGSSISVKELIGRSNGGLGVLATAVEGMVFFDELSMYPPATLARLLLPLQDKTICLHTPVGQLCYPLAPVVWAATNTCPCGNFGQIREICTCTPQQISRYRAAISQPLLERFSMHIAVPAEVVCGGVGQNAANLANCISKFWGNSEKLVWSKEAEDILHQAAKKLILSPRVQKHIAAIAETISSFDGFPQVSSQAVLEALQYRPRNPGTNIG